MANDLTDADSEAPSASLDAQAWSVRVEALRGLVNIFQESRLSELECEDSGVRYFLKSASASAQDFSRAVDVPSEGEPAPTIVSGSTRLSSAPANDPALVTVVAPMIGTFYRAASPTDPNFVEEGDHVELGQPLALIEIMKVFNEITSELEGTVVSVKAPDRSEVQAGDALMTIRRA